MTVLRAMLILAVTAFAAEFQATFKAHFDFEWTEWKEKYGKTYVDMKEEIRRKQIWEANRAYIEKHNAEANAGVHSHTLSLNYYGDYDSNDFWDTYYTPHKTTIPTFSCTNTSFHLRYPDDDNLPDEVDWRREGYVTAVRNQDFPWSCSACWSFSAIGSLEGQHFKATGKLETLSEQNLIDCSWINKDHGCTGGWMDYAFKYIIEHGIEAERTYPYTGSDDGFCQFDSTKVVATMSECVDVTPREDELALKKAVAHIGPISVGIDANYLTMQFHADGIYEDYNCSPDNINHAVLLVGYGTENGKDYWLIKNSWGIDWGNDGYFKLARNKNNHCGIATVASYPVI